VSHDWKKKLDKMLADAELDQAFHPEEEKKEEEPPVVPDRYAHIFGARFNEAKFDTFKLYGSEEEQDRQAVARDTCRAYAENLHRMHEIPDNTLVLAGNPGTGKNHLAYAIIKRAAMLRTHFEIVKVIELMREIKQSWKHNSDMTETEIIQKYSRTKLLILEEVGVSYGTDNEKIILFDIIDNRYKANLPTIIITNLGREMFFKYMDMDGQTRIEDRLKESGIIISFDWSSYREYKRRRNQTSTD
jgi:DNA replication protein DnaC